MGPSCGLHTIGLSLWNTYLLFNTDFVSFMWKTDEEEVESIVFFLIVFLRVLESSVDEEWWGGAESLI